MEENSRAGSVEQRRALSVDGDRRKILDQLAERGKSLSIDEENENETSPENNSDCDEVFPQRAELLFGQKKKRTNLRRTMSAFAPSPDSKFGPKGVLQQIQKDQLIILQDPSTQRLQWTSTPTDLLIIRKNGPTIVREFRQIAVKIHQRGFVLYVEQADFEYLIKRKDNDLTENSQRFFSFDRKKHSCKIDLVICLGGDGTLIHTASIFQKNCPPVLSFSLGSLGFLTPFRFEHHDKVLDDVLSGNVAVLLRTRLNSEIIFDENQNSTNNEKNVNFLALNEVVIDRGVHPYLSNLDIYINDTFITKVQGDGLIISTPTGSTAYAMAAGASMVHPNVPAIVLSPICPHSLSFRPTIVPAGIELKIKVSEDARVSARVCIDGRDPSEITIKDCVRITSSVYPVPVICQRDLVADWFDSLAGILHWNLRKFQANLTKGSGLDDESDDDDEKSGS